MNGAAYRLSLGPPRPTLASVPEVEEPATRMAPPERRRLILLLAPVGLMFVCGAIGTAFSPTLLVEQPLLLVGLAPLWRHLVLASPAIDPVPFYLVAVARLFAVDPFLYLVGREFGQNAIEFLKTRFKRIGRIVEWTERLFARWALPTLFFAPGALISLLAGVSRMRWPVFVGVNLAGTFTWVTIVRIFGAHFADVILDIRAFVEANLTVLTLATLSIVVVSTWLRRRRMKLDDLTGDSSDEAEAPRGSTHP